MQWHEKRERAGKIASLIGICCNVLLAAAKIAVGWISGMISVAADGLNNLSDCGGSAVSLLSFRLSSRPADEEHPYGHERTEYVCSMVVAFLILLVAFELGKESVGKIISPAQSTFSVVLLAVLCASIAVKACLFVYNRALAKTYNSDILRATATDSLSDCIATTVVIIGMVIGKFTGFNPDGYVGVLVALFIAWSGVNVLRETMSKLIGQAAPQEVKDDIKNRITAHPEVLGLHDLNVYAFGPNRYYASVHIELDASVDVLESHELVDKIEQEFARETNVALTGHLDPVVTDDEEVNALKQKVCALVGEIDQTFSVHDFRLVRGPSHTNMVFEVAVPFGCKTTEGEIKKQIKQKIAVLGDEYTPVFLIERQA